MATFYAADVTSIRVPGKAPVGTHGARIRVAHGSYSLVAGFVSGEILVLARLPVIARPLELWLGWDDLGGTMTMDLGLYQTDGTILDVNEFASGLAGGSAATLADQIYQAAATDLDRQGRRLWEFASVAADPGGLYDLAVTFTTVTTPTTGADLSWRFNFAID